MGTLASVINSVSTFVRVASEVADLAEANEAMPSANENIAVRAARMAVRMFELAIFGGEWGARKLGANNSALSSIKGAELAVRIVDVPLSCVEAVRDAQNVQDGIDVIKIVEKNVLAPIVSVFRTATEGEIYQKKAYLEATPEERSKLTYLIAEKGIKAANGKTDPSLCETECKQRLAKLEAHEPGVKLVEAVFKARVLSRAALFGAVTAQLLELITSDPALFAQVNGPALFVHVPVPVPVQNDDAAFDLLAVKSIPAPLHDDEVFRRFQCPISSLPIRDPVGDPNGTTVYERSAIHRWIEQSGTSPITRFQLSIDQLIEKPDLKALIDQRLQFHQAQILLLIQNTMLHPADPVLLAAAHAETPALAN